MLGVVAWRVAVRDGDMMEAGRNANATCTCRLHWCKLHTIQALYLVKPAHCGYVSAANQRLRGLEHVCRIPGSTLPKQLLFCVYSGLLPKFSNLVALVKPSHQNHWVMLCPWPKGSTLDPCWQSLHLIVHVYSQRVWSLPCKS